jgi:hypothetical protein
VRPSSRTPPPSPFDWKLLFEKGFRWVGLMRRGNHTDTTKVHLSARWSPSTLCQPNESLSWLAVSRQMDWEGGGSIARPPWSPDLTPVDFSLWGHIKDLVYQTEVQDVNELCCQITAACETFTPVVLQNTWHEVECCLHICWSMKGTYVDLLRNFKTLKLSASFSEFPFFYLY